MRRIRSCVLALLAALCLSACAKGEGSPAPAAAETPAAETAPAVMTEQTEAEMLNEEDETAMLQMRIGDTAVQVDWEDNESVEALRELCREGELLISLSMYGGFEQVGSLGTSLPRRDVHITTGAGDVVLYSGSQIVVFYGSNTWAYTRLGHISDRSAEELAQLLGQGDVTITLGLEGNQ